MISVIIPIYNADKQLERMLQSIQKQSYENYEVIMIDDGSCDQSAEICKKYVENDVRFYYYYQKNSGVSMARNSGLKKAQGDYIAFLDADDEIDINYFEMLMQTCRNVDIAVCDVVVEKDGREINRFSGEDLMINKEDAINLLLMRKIINSGPYAKLYKREVIGTLEFPLMKTYEDMIFNLDVFSRASTIAITLKTQYHYIENSQGAMSVMKKAPSLDIIVASDQIMCFIKENNNDLNPECLYVTISHLFQYVLSMINGECVIDVSFLMKTKVLYKKYMLQILKCKAVPMKEKIVFFCFTHGWLYTNKKWTYINNLR